MAQAYHCLPTDLWPTYNPATPKGFYFNRGVYYWGNKVQNEMERADQAARKNRKGLAADRMANAARLGVLEKYLGTTIKRHREPDNFGTFGASGQMTDSPGKQKEESIIIKLD